MKSVALRPSHTLRHRQSAQHEVPDDRRAGLEVNTHSHEFPVSEEQVREAGVCERVGHVFYALKIENNLVAQSQLRFDTRDAEGVTPVPIGKYGGIKVIPHANDFSVHGWKRFSGGKVSVSGIKPNFTLTSVRTSK